MDREGHIKPMTIGARLYRLENQVKIHENMIQPQSYQKKSIIYNRLPLLCKSIYRLVMLIENLTTSRR